MSARPRSLLFVPGHKERWVDSALASEADALVLDLEDSVPESEKPGARESVARSIARVRKRDQRVGVWARPNAWESALAGLDLEAVVAPGLDGLLLAKVYGTREVLHFDTLLSYFEARRGMPDGTVKLMIPFETAESLDRCEELARACPRVVSLVGSTARDADTARALGYIWTPDGLETLYLRSRILLAARAAGLEHPVCGVWQDVSDVDGLVRFARQNAELGYRGQLIIHPSHAALVNRAFTPSDAEVAFARGVIEAYERGTAGGSGAVTYEGQHIDHAHVKTAREALARARQYEP